MQLVNIRKLEIDWDDAITLVREEIDVVGEEEEGAPVSGILMEKVDNLLWVPMYLQADDAIWPIVTDEVAEKEE